LQCLLQLGFRICNNIHSISTTFTVH
jgi:hypothetical protein